MNIKRYELNNYIRNNEKTIVLFVNTDSNKIYKILNTSKYKIPFSIDDDFNYEFLDIWCMSRDFEIDVFNGISGYN